MNAIDWAIVSLLLLSVLFAFYRGFTRQLIALFSWVLGFVAALSFSTQLGHLLPDFGSPPTLRYLIAFGIILIGALLVGALIAWPLRDLLHRSGMGFLDRFLGGLFGVVRGVVLVARGFTTSSPRIRPRVRRDRTVSRRSRPTRTVLA